MTDSVWSISYFLKAAQQPYTARVKGFDYWPWFSVCRFSPHFLQFTPTAQKYVVFWTIAWNNTYTTTVVWYSCSAVWANSFLFGPLSGLMWVPVKTTPAVGYQSTQRLPLSGTFGPPAPSPRSEPAKTELNSDPWCGEGILNVVLEIAPPSLWEPGNGMQSLKNGSHFWKSFRSIMTSLMDSCTAFRRFFMQSRRRGSEVSRPWLFSA